ncbi:MAG: carbohydrate ABC transporter permease [Rhodospirillaceae bacterium]|nr:carbohydrate ABC transporter permease [Rhodospirillaceae bacterium]
MTAIPQPAPRRPRPDLALKHAILVLATVVALAPSAFMIVTSLKSDAEYTLDKVGLPDSLVLDHYRSVIFESDFFGWMGNSIILAAGAVALSTVVSCLGAYAIARMQFAGRGLLFSLSTSLMAIPPVVMIVPLFVLYTQLKLISTYQGAILIYAGLITPFSVYLLTSFFRTLPKEIFESARIDGASDLLILLKIVIPLSLPALLTLVVVNALYVWNDLLIAIIFLQDDSKRTLMAGISVFQGRYGDQIPLTMAGMVFASAPMVILYLAFQKHYIQGLMAGSIK